MNDIEREKLLPKIARLYYLEDMNQDEIAKKFNINRVRVSRYLKKARESNIVEIKIHSSKESYQDLEHSIENKYSLKECIVIPSHEEPEEILSSMATALTSILERILKNGDTIGVNWGLTLKGVVGFMHSTKKIKIKVVPIVGGMGRIETGIHTNSIAKNLADVFSGISYIINAPAILDSKETKDVLLRDSNTKQIFELLKDLDCVVFSFSDLGPESSYAIYSFINPEEREYLKELGIVGDVNLDFINKKGEHVSNKINDRVITLPLSKIKKIRNVIGIAFGSRKAEITKAVLQGSIIDIIIIDKDLAELILNDRA
jgi:DNA-binding transcriptional regulator LsrR (DeoR family)